MAAGLLNLQRVGLLTDVSGNAVGGGATAVGGGATAAAQAEFPHFLGHPDFPELLTCISPPPGPGP